MGHPVSLCAPHLLPVPLREHLLLLPALELSGAGGEARPHLPHDLPHLVGVEVVRRVPDLVTRYGQLREGQLDGF